MFLNKYEQDQEEKKKLKEQIQDHHQQITLFSFLPVAAKGFPAACKRILTQGGVRYLKQLTSLPPGAEELAAKDAVIKACTGKSLHADASSILDVTTSSVGRQKM